MDFWGSKSSLWYYDDPFSRSLFSSLSLSLSLCIPLILLQMYMEDKRHSAAGTSVTLDQHMLMWLARRLLEGILLHAKLEYGAFSLPSWSLSGECFPACLSPCPSPFRSSRLELVWRACGHLMAVAVLSRRGRYCFRASRT